MISCQTAAKLICNELDRRLGLPQRVNLEIHSILCVGCRRFRRQLKIVDLAVKEYLSDEIIPISESGLSITTKERLELMIEQELCDE